MRVQVGVNLRSFLSAVKKKGIVLSVSLALSNDSLVIDTAKKTSVYRTENEGWIYGKRGNLLSFTRVLPMENPTFSARFPIGESQYSFHYSVVFLRGKCG